MHHCPACIPLSSCVEVGSRWGLVVYLENRNRVAPSVVLWRFAEPLSIQLFEVALLGELEQTSVHDLSQRALFGKCEAVVLLFKKIAHQLQLR